MCISKGAPPKPAYGACHERHQRREKVRIPIMSELTACSVTTESLDTMVEVKYKEEWRYC